MINKELENLKDKCKSNPAFKRFLCSTLAKAAYEGFNSQDDNRSLYKEIPLEERHKWVKSAVLVMATANAAIKMAKNKKGYPK